MARDPAYDIPVYSPTARFFHWIVALLVFVQVPIGFYMVYRGNEMETVNDKGETVKGVWDGLTNTLYSSHKTIGLLIFAIVVLRLIYRLTQGAPRSDQTVPAALTGISHLVHWSLYLLLLAVPIGGYIAISYGNYLDVFGIKLPALVAEDKDASKLFFEYHEIGATVLLALVVLHLLAAIFHRFIRRDRVVERMLPNKVV